MTEEAKVGPFLIGVVDGGLTNEIISQLEKHLEGYPICTISLTNYFKDMQDENNLYMDPKKVVDFELLQSDLVKMRNNEPCEIPIYDIKTKKRCKETRKIESCQIVILEGLYCFCDDKITNLMDLKIFIDTDNDIRLARTITKGISEGNTKIIDIILKFHNFIKPSYINFISPTKKNADIIIPKAKGNETAVEIITDYLKLLLSKTKNDNETIFSFHNEIIDPKFVFFPDKLFIKKEEHAIVFLKKVFKDFIRNSLDEEFNELIRRKLLELILSLLVESFRKNKNYAQNIPKIDKFIFGSEDLTSINFEECNYVLFFKTAILEENDLKIPEYILSKNKNCNIAVNSIFLAPKCAQSLLSNQNYSIFFTTLYFNEFFAKYNQIIKDDKTIFNEKELEKTFTKLFKENFDSLL